MNKICVNFTKFDKFVQFLKILAGVAFENI